MARIGPERAAQGGTGRADEPPWICFCGQDWWYHNRAHSDFQLMTRVARRTPVLLVNSIAMRMPLPGRSPQALQRIGRKLRSLAKLVRRPLHDTPGFHVMTPLILPFYGIAWARRLNAWLVRLQVRAVARALGIEEPVLFVTIPTAWEVVKPMRRRALLFNRSDKHSEFEETDQEAIRGLERNLLEQADRVIYVSHALLDDEHRYTGERARFLDHGVDLDHFARRPRPEPTDLRAIPRPRIGFFGGIDDYVVDLDLLERVAREIPEASLVLVGSATCSMKRFEALPNVHWLDFRPYAEIPDYGAAFDVALMPWLENEWIRCCNPIKLKEYLALGLPVVSTDFPEVHRYARVVRVAKTGDDFVELVRRSLKDGGPATPAERSAAVAGATWEARADDLLAIAREASAR